MLVRVVFWLVRLVIKVSSDWQDATSFLKSSFVLSMGGRNRLILRCALDRY